MNILIRKTLLFKNNCKNFLLRISDTILLKKFSFKNFSKLFFLGVFISILICLLDLYSKRVVFELINKFGESFVINGLEFKEIKITSFFSLVRVLNTGVSFGMFSDLNNSNIIFTFIQGGIAIGLLFWLYQVKNLYLTIAISLIIGGALGNSIDRYLSGGVADFLDFYINSYHWPAFNLADTSIFIGVSLLIIDEFIIKKNHD